MEKTRLKSKTIDKAAAIAGNYTELAKMINRSYRSLLDYRTKGVAPKDIASAIESIANK
jgi:hypothetical protein